MTMQTALKKARRWQEQTEAVDAERADRIADRVAEVAVLVLGRLDRLALPRIAGREDQRAVQCERQAVGEEERHRDHVDRVVVEVAVLVAGVRHPIEMGDDAVGKSVAPCAEQIGRITTSVK